jgi:hypothetical protein
MDNHDRQNVGYIFDMSTLKFNLLNFNILDDTIIATAYCGDNNIAFLYQNKILVYNITDLRCYPIILQGIDFNVENFASLTGNQFLLGGYKSVSETKYVPIVAKISYDPAT